MTGLIDVKVCLARVPAGWPSTVYTNDEDVDLNVVGYLNVVGNDEAGFNEFDCSFC